MLYADDIFTVAKQHGALEQGVNEWYEELGRRIIMMNVEKSKMVVVVHR